MNIGTIVTTNMKGQVVIPAKVRYRLGITAQTPLQVEIVGQDVVFHPVARVVRKGDFTDEMFAEILKKTQGAWGPASPEEIKWEKEKRKKELKASEKRRNAW